MLTRETKALLAIAFLALSGSAHAAGLQFMVRVNDAPVRGAQVCFFGHRGARLSIAQQFLGKDVECLPADQRLDLPEGNWSVWAQKGDLVSGDPQEISVTDSDGGVQLIEMDLVRAGRLGVRGVSVDERAFVYLTNDISPEPMLSTFRPTLTPGDEALVPAESTTMPLTVRDGGIACVGEPIRVQAGALAVSGPCVPPKATHDVVLWLQPDVLQEAPGDLEVTLEQNGQRFDSILKPNPYLFRSLLAFRGLHPGRATARISGVRWSGPEQTVTVGEGAVTTIEEPIKLVLASEAVVRWSLDDAVRAAGGDVGCDAEQNSAPLDGVVRLLRCDADHPRDCSLIEEQRFAIESSSGERVFRARPGRYTLEFVAGNYTVRDVLIQSGKSSSTPLRLTAGQITGTVTRDGRPLSAVVTMGGGSSRSDPGTGAYSIPVTKSLVPGRVVAVTPCGESGDTSFRTLLEHSLSAGDVYDIDVPENELTVHVTDSAGVAAIPEAAVEVLLTFEEAIYDTIDLPKTDEKGRSRLRSVKANVPLTVCAGATGYERACKADITVGKNESKDVAIELTAKRINARLHADRPIAGGKLFSVSHGSVLWSSDVSSDGSFTVRGSADTLVFVSSTYPLYVLKPPPQTAPFLDLDLPLASIRGATLVVKSGPVTRGNLGISVGDVQLPGRVVAENQARRFSPSQFQKDVPLRIAEIAETAPIRVYLAPMPSAQSLPYGYDPFVFPEIVATLPSQIVDRAMIVFSDER